MNTFLEIIRRYRKAIIGVAVAVVVYSLLGFFLAPWLVEKNAVETVREQLGVELSMTDVAINPFTMSLKIEGLEFDDPDGEPLLKVGRIFVNFQSSSLFRWAWTFREIHIDDPHLYVSRANDGEFNFAFLAGAGDAADEEPAPSDEDKAPVRLLIADFAIRNSVVDWSDAVPPEDVQTRFGPIDVAIAQLNTLPERSGQQDVVIVTETQGTLSWSGSLQLNPLHSEGRASVKGSHFPIVSAYLKHETGFDIVEGEADVEFGYRVATGADGQIEARVDDFNLAFSDISVENLNDTTDAYGEYRELLNLPSMRLSGGEFRWPQRVVSAQSLAIDDAAINVRRLADGEMAIGSQEIDTEAAEAPEPGVDEAAGEPWELSLGQFAINRLALELEDNSVDPVARIGWRSLDLEISDISNKPDAAFPLSMALLARQGGSINTDGTLQVLPDLALDLGVTIDALALAGAHPYLQPLADVNLDSGVLNASARMRHDANETLSIGGEFEIADFLITETDEGSRLGSWTSLAFNEVAFSAANETLTISEVRFTEPYGDILIAEDGSINLGRVSKTDASEEATEDAPPSADEAEPEPAEQSPFAVTVGRVVVSQAAADFADFSLPLPFEAKIADLNGELSTIATGSAEPSVVSLQGGVDEFGEVNISGTLTPLDPPANTDIKIEFRNVDMPKFSAYSIPFAGREIASGRLDLDLGYQLDGGDLVGENKVVLRDFELGEKIDHPGAMSLPLGLAVALLKDPDGRISLDVPVRGNVDDPEFKYGRVVRKALVNLLTKIVTSPFALLGNLVGAKPDELEFIVFAPGVAEASPPEREKILKLASALAMRPNLMLQIGGVYEGESDALAIRTSKLEQAIEQRMGESDDDDTPFVERQREVVEQLYVEAAIAEDTATALAALRAEHTVVDEESGEEQFDELAFTESLRRQLVDVQPLADDELLSLAVARAETVRAEIVGAEPEQSARIIVTEAAGVEADDNGNVPMRVQLTVDEDLAPDPDTGADNGGTS